MFHSQNLYKEILDNLYDGVYLVDKYRKILYWNATAEKISGFSQDETIGTLCWDNLLKHINKEGQSLCQGECPLSKTIQDGQMREADVFLHHKDGHRVPVSVRIAPVYNEDKEIVGAIEIFNENTAKQQLLESLEELQKQALLDPLTNLANRRFIEKILETKLGELHRNEWPFGLLFMDIDHFKIVNDTYGHDIGDQVLQMVANTLASNSRHIDIPGRWGGEEFVVVLSHVNRPKLLAIAERMRMLVEQASLRLPESALNVTISIGATRGYADDTLQTLIKRADQKMYQSKTTGRNRVTCD